MKVLIIAIFPAPYRVEVFHELGKYADLTVMFERKTDFNRTSDWFSDQFINFNGYLLCDNSAKNKKSIKEAYRLLLKRSYDLVFFYDYTTFYSLLLCLICMILNIPYFLNCDGAFINSSKVKQRLKRFYIKKAAGYLASGKMAANYFLYHGAKRNKIYYHPFTSLYAKDILISVPTLEEKLILRQKLQLSGKKIVITASRFIASKRIDILIEAWLSIPKEYQLVIVGSGDLEKKYKEQCKELGLNHVLFTAFLNKKDLFQYLKASDFFVFPTESDTWGLVVNEAMACGLPVITTNQCIAGLELIKNNVNGILVPAKNKAALYQAMMQLLSNESVLRIMSENALNTIRPYTYENIAKSHRRAMKDYIKSKKVK